MWRMPMYSRIVVHRQMHRCMLACLQPGDKILGLDLSMGGHLTHGSPVNYSGKLYKAVIYGVKKETGLVDYDMIGREGKGAKTKNDHLWCICI